MHVVLLYALSIENKPQIERLPSKCNLSYNM